ncbi:MAG: low molecular weight phosphotyrosine protein phosphatase [Bacteroidetes bacterium]|jgi:protein-tyrosine phosphatase|nr:low molecular weight phosphotyrosine protein phosphatase [Bacteroidota bacterium]
MKILMVCLGNICRSPLAEGILRHKIKEAELDWEVQSAGTGSWHIGEAPDPRSQKIAKINGIDISKQKAQKFTQKLFSEFDRIYTMDSSNYRDVVNMAINEEDKNKVELIMNLVEPGKNKAVPDPYYDDDLYATVYEMLDKACEEIMKELMYQ